MGVGINLKEDVIMPLLKIVSNKYYMTICIENKIAIVTGAGSGIGRAVALKLLKEKVNVFLVGRTIKKLNDTKDPKLKKNGFSSKAIVFKIENVSVLYKHKEIIIRCL